MKSRIPYILSFAFALAVSAPTVQALSISDADAAGPGSTLSQSRAPGRRVHKVQASTQKKQADSSKKKSNSSSQSNSQTQRTTTNRSAAPARSSASHARPQGPPQATGRTRPAGSSARPTTTTRRRTTSRPVSSRRTRVHGTRYSNSYTEVHHHHYHEGDTRRVSTARRVDYEDEHPNVLDGYFTLGLSTSGFAAGQIVDGALSGLEYNIGLGAKGDLFGGELGLHGGVYTLGSADGESDQIDFSIFGLSFDLKLQPSLGVFEPYALVGVGGYIFQDGVMQESAGGGAIRLGAGADFRFDNFAIGARYLFTGYAFSNASLYHDLTAQTESLGINASFYF